MALAAYSEENNIPQLTPNQLIKDNKENGPGAVSCSGNHIGHIKGNINTVSCYTK